MAPAACDIIASMAEGPRHVSDQTVDPAEGRRRQLLWRLGAAVLFLFVFWRDARTPLGVAVPVLYVVPVLICLWAGRFWESLVSAALATVLALAAFSLSGPGQGREVAVMNRGLALALIWITAVLVAWYRRGAEQVTASAAQARLQARESVQRLEEIRDALDQAAIVAVTDQRGIINYVNDKFCEISKYSRDELLGQDHRIINSGYHSKEFIRDLWRTIAQGRVWRGELRNRAKDGSIYWVDTTIVPFVDARGKPWQYLAIRSDITQRKAAEAQLRDQAALAQLGQLAAVVAHEVRNPLAGLKASLQVFEQLLPADLSEREIVGPMIDRIDELNAKVQDILTYARPSQPKLQPFDIGPLIHEVASNARAESSCSEIRVNGESAIVTGDPEMVRAALLNLLLNACQASGGAAVELTTRTGDGFYEIAVLDRGPGIPEDLREHVFEPFVTTKPRGTGLGLAIARRLMSLQSGSVTLSDRQGGGTAAVLRLPLARVAAASGPRRF
jgi:PAS domain S-box-containing protein